MSEVPRADQPLRQRRRLRGRLVVGRRTRSRQAACQSQPDRSIRPTWRPPSRPDSFGDVSPRLLDRMERSAGVNEKPPGFAGRFFAVLRALPERLIRRCRSARPPPALAAAGCRRWWLSPHAGSAGGRRPVRLAAGSAGVSGRCAAVSPAGRRPGSSPSRARSSAAARRLFGLLSGLGLRGGSATAAATGSADRDRSAASRRFRQAHSRFGLAVTRRRSARMNSRRNRRPRSCASGADVGPSSSAIDPARPSSGPPRRRRPPRRPRRRGRRSPPAA